MTETIHLSSVTGVGGWVCVTDSPSMEGKNAVCTTKKPLSKTGTLQITSTTSLPFGDAGFEK